MILHQLKQSPTIFNGEILSGEGIKTSARTLGDIKEIFLDKAALSFYAVSVGPLGWLIISEIFPQRLRGMGSSIGSLCVWVFNSIVTFTFFKIAKLLSVPGTEITVDGEVIANPAGSFFFYALIAVIGIIWGLFFMPETKGKSLEDIESHWKKGGSPKELS